MLKSRPSCWALLNHILSSTLHPAKVPLKCGTILTTFINKAMMLASFNWNLKSLNSLKAPSLFRSITMASADRGPNMMRLSLPRCLQHSYRNYFHYSKVVMGISFLWNFVWSLRQLDRTWWAGLLFLAWITAFRNFCGKNVWLLKLL